MTFVCLIADARPEIFRKVCCSRFFYCPKRRKVFGINYRKAENQNEAKDLCSLQKTNAQACCEKAADFKKGGTEACKIPRPYGNVPTLTNSL